jgi:hypothetical protein
MKLPRQTNRVDFARTLLWPRMEELAGNPRSRATTARAETRSTLSSRCRMPGQHRDWAAGGRRLLPARDDGCPGRDSDRPRGTWGDSSLATSRGRGTWTGLLRHTGRQRERGDGSGMCRDPGSLSDTGRGRRVGTGPLLRVPGKGWRDLDFDRWVSGGVIGCRLKAAHSHTMTEASKDRRMS